MIYSYECYDCQHAFEANESIKAEPQTVCPACNGSTRRVITSCPYFTMNTIHTIGQQADRNWKKMGTYEREDKCEADGVNASIKRHKVNKENQKISQMTGEQKEKYIKTGQTS